MTGQVSCGNPSRARYVQGCRCYMCRVANAEYAAANARGETHAMVGEDETVRARERVNRWRSRGVGLRTVELWTGVSRSALQTLVDGSHANCNGLPRRMKRENYEAIMAASVGPRGAALVPAKWALDAFSKLRARGWTYKRIASESGVSLATVHRLAYRHPERVTAMTSDAICATWRQEAHGRRASNRGPNQGPVLSDWEWAEAERIYRLEELSVAKIAERYKVTPQCIVHHMKNAGEIHAERSRIGCENLPPASA